MPRAAEQFSADAGKQESARMQALSRALHRTRTDDPFLTMEVLYQLS